jgi:molybdopterin converting factor small subunit
MVVELPAGATVADLSPVLHLPAELVRSAFINNEAAAPLTTVLQEGDQVGLFPPVVGGSIAAHDKIRPAAHLRPYSLSG